ncbi:MAG: CapA family protein [Ignavibacterium sp.]|nr:MAG: CapA family protein [Ignavibacterium sp.]
MKRIIQIVVLLIVIIPAYLYYSGLATKTSIIEIQGKKDSIITISISFVGDLMCHSTQFNYAYVEEDSFDFNGVFSEVKKYFNVSDFTIGNLETVFAGKELGYSGYPFFNAPDDFLFALKEAGFDFLITANNHALDQGEKGVRRTIYKLDELEIKHTGTFLSEKDRTSYKKYSINGIDVAIIAYSYGTNDVPIPKGKNYLINLIDTIFIKEDISNVKKLNPDITLVYFHFGEEYTRSPDSFQEEVVQKTIEYGADIIIGSHPHVIQPVNYFKTNNGNIDTGFVAYSLGNFISNQRWRYTDVGVILTMDITKNFTKDSVYINAVNILPTWVYKGDTKKGKGYIILPASIESDHPVMNYLTEEDKFKMHQAFSDTDSILSRKYNDIPIVIRNHKDKPYSDYKSQSALQRPK